MGRGGVMPMFSSPERGGHSGPERGIWAHPGTPRAVPAATGRRVRRVGAGIRGGHNGPGNEGAEWGKL